MPDGARVYLIDGADNKRRGCARVLGAAGYEVRGFASAREFVDVAPIIAAGLVLDVRPLKRGDDPSPGALTALRADLPVIVMSSSEGDVELAVKSIKAGAADYLEASCSDERLLAAVAAALEAVASVERQEQEATFAAARIAEMTIREREVLERLLLGGTNKTIAKDLGISPRTVEIHRAHVMERLGARNLSEVVRMALAAGLGPSRGPGAGVRISP